MRDQVDDPTDVILVCNKQRFQCHRQTLARHSPYFAAMFNSNMVESRADEVTLQGITPASLKLLIDYAYTTKFSATDHNVHRALEAAAMFQFDAVRDACVEYLRSKLCPANCLGVMLLTDALGLTDLYRRAREMAFWEFELVGQKCEVLDLQRPALETYLSHDGLRIDSELGVFECVERWVMHSPEERAADFLSLLGTVRFRDVTQRELLAVMRSMLVKNNPHCLVLLGKVQALKKNNGSAKCQSCPPSSPSLLSSVTSLSFFNTDFSRGLKEPKDCGDGEWVRMAQQLVSLPSRSIPMVPVVVGYLFSHAAERDSAPDLAYYDAQAKSVVRLGTGIKKVFTSSHVAIGYRVCAVGPNIYVSGGEFRVGYGNWVLAVWRYDTFTETWHFASNLPQPRRNHSVCVLNDDIYFIGGIGRFRVLMDNVDRYNTGTGEWETCHPLAKATFSAACTAHNGKVFVLTTDVCSYDPKTNAWTQMRRTKLPNEMGFHTALSHANGIYLVGRHSQSLVLYSPDGGDRGEDKLPYIVVGEFNLPTENACIIGNRIYSFSAKDSCSVEMYDIPSNSFTVECRTSLNAPSVCHGCFSLPFYRS